MSSVQDFYRKRYSNVSAGRSRRDSTLDLTVEMAFKAIGQTPRRILDPRSRSERVVSVNYPLSRVFEELGDCNGEFRKPF